MNVSFDNTNNNNNNTILMGEPDLRKQLQLEKNKNVLLSKMVEEEQENYSELLVYKQEMEYYINKNRELTKEVNLLNKSLMEVQLTRKVSPSRSATNISTVLASPRRNASVKSPRNLA
jgi:hypothetical protein